MLTFDAVAHAYTLDGSAVPSMTQVLKDLRLVSFDHLPPWILEAARSRGHAVHQLCHYDCEGDLDETSIADVYRPYLEAWRRCRRDRGIVPLLCEYRVASSRLRLAGTFDLLCESAGEGWLLDFATGDPEACGKRYQTAGYLLMAHETARTDERLAAVLRRFAPHWRRAAVQLCADASYRVREYRDPRDLSAVQALATTWHVHHERTYAESQAAC